VRGRYDIILVGACGWHLIGLTCSLADSGPGASGHDHLLDLTRWQEIAHASPIVRPTGQSLAFERRTARQCPRAPLPRGAFFRPSVCSGPVFVAGPLATETGLHVRLELRNVVANYPFESSRGFLGSEPNSGHGDHSRLSCSAGDTQLGAGSAGIFSKRSARTLAIMRRRREGTN